MFGNVIRQPDQNASLMIKSNFAFMIMYRSWLVFTAFSIIFFVLCLIMVIFFNTPVTRSFGEELTFLVSIINMGMAYSFYRHNREEFSARWRQHHKK